MRIRDVVIIAVAFVCSIICWSQEGSLNFQRGFSIPILSSELTESIMPKPLVVDPDGSGSRVLLASTTVGRLSLYRTQYSRRRIDDAFVRLYPYADINVYSSIVGIGAGCTAFNSSVMMGAIVTEDYQLTAISLHTPQPTILWKSKIIGSRYWTNLMHASISIVPERSWDKDQGMVAVAVRVRAVSGVEMMMYAAYNALSGERRWSYFSDGGNEMDGVVREANRNMSVVGGDREMLPLPFGAKVTEDAQNTQKDANTYEQPWTKFRESVMAAMPHRYNHLWDAQLYPHIFYRPKAKSKARSNAFKRARRAVLRYNDQVVHMETDDYGDLGEKLASIALTVQYAKKKSALNARERRRRRPSNVFVFHGEHGVEVVHLYTGHTVTRLMPLRSHDTCFDDINDDLMLESVSAQVGSPLGPHPPQGGEGEVECLGNIVTGVPSSADTLFSTPICDTPGLFGNLDLIHHFVDGDVRGEETPHVLNRLELLGSRSVVSATTRAAPPLIVQVQEGLGGGLYQVERYAVFLLDTGLVTCVDPSRRRVLWRTHTGAHFTPSASNDMAEMKEHRVISEKEVRPFAQLVPYSLSQKSRETNVMYVGGGKEPYSRVDSYVLAVGDAEISIIQTKNGKVARSIALEEPPVAPVLVVDFNGDNTNDLIVVSKYHIYGFVGNSQATSETVALLMVLLLGLLGILFAAREKSIAEGGEDEYTLPVYTNSKVLGKKKIRRSTD